MKKLSKNERKQLRNMHRGRKPRALSENYSFNDIKNINTEKQTTLKTVIRTDTQEYRQREIGQLAVRFKITSQKGTREVITGTSGLGLVKSSSKEMFREAQKSAIAQFMEKHSGANYAGLTLEPVQYHFIYYDQIKSKYERRQRGR